MQTFTEQTQVHIIICALDQANSNHKKKAKF